MAAVWRAGLLAGWALIAGAGSAIAEVDVEARLSMGTIEVGGVVSLLVTVTDPKGTVADPQFPLPAGLELLGSSRSQQFSWVNGRSTNQVLYRFELGAARVGRYSVGPLRVTVGGQTFRSGEMALVVSAGAPAAAAPARGRGRGSHAASLVLSLEPRNPVVGQACVLRVQLIQRVNMAEDSEYDPPATPGFWSEKWGDASAYRAKEGRNDVSVTESSLRLYPLAPGPAVISPARGVVTPAAGGGLDLFGRGIAGNRLQIQSDSLRVSVRPLPRDPPASFGGGVGELSLEWSTDRSHTTQDQAITARLDIRGLGNLPLLRAPRYAPNDFEVFSSTVEDSLPAAGRLGPGRRTFLWTLLPKRAGRLRLAAPTVSWFDPSASRYVTQTPSTQLVEVLSARGGPTGEDADGLPTVFRSRPSRPGGRAAWPIAALGGGVLLALAFGAWRRSRAPDPSAPDRARQREWLRSIGLVRGPDFWRAADEASTWLQARGDQVLRIREAISAARFGGRTDQEGDVRRWLVERLGASMPAPPGRWPWQMAAVFAVASGVALAVWAMPRAGVARLNDRAVDADTHARSGDVARAEAEWARLWDENPGDAALAARLAWSALQRDDVAAATVWVIRGDRREARDPALAVVARRVRDAGGLVGAPGRAIPFRSGEWAVMAFVLAAASGFLWPRRPWGAALLGLAVVAGLWWPLESEWRMRQRLAVVRTSIALPPGDILLDSGQVVRVKRRAGDQVTVRAASELEGTLPASAFWFPGPR